MNYPLATSDAQSIAADNCFSDKRIVQLLEGTQAAMLEARRVHIATFQACFPVNGYVRWKHAPYINSGIVMDHCQFEAALFVQEHRTGKRRKINDYSIIEALKDES